MSGKNQNGAGAPSDRHYDEQTRIDIAGSDKGDHAERQHGPNTAAHTAIHRDEDHHSHLSKVHRGSDNVQDARFDDPNGADGGKPAGGPNDIDGVNTSFDPNAPRFDGPQSQQARGSQGDGEHGRDTGNGGIGRLDAGAGSPGNGTPDNPSLPSSNNAFSGLTVNGGPQQTPAGERSPVFNGATVDVSVVASVSAAGNFPSSSRSTSARTSSSTGLLAAASRAATASASAASASV